MGERTVRYVLLVLSLLALMTSATSAADISSGAREQLICSYEIVTLEPDLWGAVTAGMNQPALDDVLTTMQSIGAGTTLAKGTLAFLDGAQARFVEGPFDPRGRPAGETVVFAVSADAVTDAATVLHLAVTVTDSKAKEAFSFHGDRRVSLGTPLVVRGDRDSGSTVLVVTVRKDDAPHSDPLVAQ